MKSKKHPKANLEKFSMLFLQLGLVLALFVTYLGLENKTEHNKLFVTDFVLTNMMDIPDQTVEIEVEKPKIELEIKPVLIINKPTIIEDDDPNFIESVLKPVDPEEPVTVLGDFEDVEEMPIENDDDVPFISVEEVPTYPGCKGTNMEKKKCFSEKIQKLIGRKFNTQLAGTLGLSQGIKRIFVLFKIDKNGDIVEMRARAPHKALEKEAMRVLKFLPKMNPGKMQGRPVKVKYSLPIVFRVE